MITTESLIGLSVQEATDILNDNGIPNRFKIKDRRRHRVEWDDVPGRWTLEVDNAKVVRIRISEAQEPK